MAIEGLDAALPIENAGFRPQVGIPETPEADAGPSLDDALRQIARPENPAALGPDTLLDREAMREAAAPDLWIEDRIGTAYRPLSVGGAGTATPAFADTSDAISSDPTAPGGEGSILPPLSLKELNMVANGGRYGDSTEEGTWFEISTGSWEWLVSGFVQNARNDITQIVRGSATLEEAQQRINQYLADQGLSNIVQVYNPNHGADIVVVGAPPPPPTIYNFDLFGGGSGQNSGGGGGVTPETLQLNLTPIPDNNPDGPDVDIEVLDEANRESVIAAANLMKGAIEALDAKFAALSDTASIVLKNGQVMSGADVKAWWQTLDFRVTDRLFPHGMGGAVQDGISNIGFGTVNIWNSWDPNGQGLPFIILHELTHQSAPGHQSRDTSFTMHLATGGTGGNYNANDYWWDVNEEFANWGARALMEALGVPLPAYRPNYGYDDTMPATQPGYTPPPAGGSGGGGGNVGE